MTGLWSGLRAVYSGDPLSSCVAWLPWWKTRKILHDGKHETSSAGKLKKLHFLRYFHVEALTSKRNTKIANLTRSNENIFNDRTWHFPERIVARPGSSLRGIRGKTSLPTFEERIKKCIEFEGRNFNNLIKLSCGR